MIDLKNVYEIRNVLNNKVIDKIEDELGNIIYEAWKNLPKNGIPPLTLPKCKGVDLVDYKIYGESVQSGKNLLKPLVEGIRLDFTTGREKTGSEYASTDYIPINFNVNPNYYLSGLVNTINSCVYAYNKNKEFLGRTAGQTRNYLSLTEDSFSAGTAQGTGDIAYLRVSQYVTTSNTGSIDDIDNAEIQLEIGNTPTEYEPYKTPTPETPVEVESVGERTKNLYNGTFNEIFKLDNFIPANTNINAYGDNLSSQCYIALYDKDQNKISNYRLSSVTNNRRFVSITTTVNVYYIKFYNSELTNLMVATDSNSEYEPCGYRIPVKVGGKNLFNIEEYVSYIDISKYEIGDKLVLSLKDKYQLRIAKSAGAPGTAVNDNKFAFTMTQEFKDVGRLYIVSTKTYNWETKDNLLNQNVQLESGTVATPFEPYVEPVTTNIYLNEPLRKIGDYADYIDFENSKVVRNIKEVDMTALNFTGGGNNGQLWKVAIADLLVGSELLATNYSYSTSTPNTIKAGEFTAPSTTIYCYSGESTDKPTGNLVYPSSEIGEETLNLPNIPTHKGTTILEIDTEIQPSNMEVVYKGKSA